MLARHICMLFIVAALTAPLRPALAETIEVPPFVITQLTHQYVYDQESGDSWVWDIITIPGTGYTSSGFTAAIGTGDVVQLRIAAPTGKKFRLRTYGGTSFFGASIMWFHPDGGSYTHLNPFTTTFENLSGPTPTLRPYTLIHAGETVVKGYLGFDVLGDIEFTALRVDITVDQVLAKTPRVYGDVSTDRWPAIKGSQDTTNPDLVILEIVDDTPVPTKPTSWGRLKSLYR